MAKLTTQFLKGHSNFFGTFPKELQKVDDLILHTLGNKYSFESFILHFYCHSKHIRSVDYF